MTQQLLDNWICWVILGLALVCYHQLCLQWVTRHSENTGSSRAPHGGIHHHQDTQQQHIKRELCNTLIAAMPLLGLLGTIIGLLECFAGISIEGTSGELVSNGIATALVTTQLGLVCAIPAWLMQSALQSSLTTARLYAKPSNSLGEP